MNDFGGLLDKFVEAHDAHDFDALADLCSEDCELVGPVATVRGKEAIRAAIPTFLDAFTNDRFIVDTSLTAGSTLVFEWTYEATHAGVYHGPTEEIPASGRRISLHGVDLFDVTHDHIVRYRSYFDSLDLINQLTV